jgi:hypothetical protein
MPREVEIWSTAPADAPDSSPQGRIRDAPVAARAEPAAPVATRDGDRKAPFRVPERLVVAAVALIGVSGGVLLAWLLR